MNTDGTVPKCLNDFFSPSPSSVTFPNSWEHSTLKRWNIWYPVFGLTLSGYVTFYQFITLLISNFPHQENGSTQALLLNVQRGCVN